MPKPRAIPNLGHAARSLADAVNASMAVLYQLQSDLSNNALTQSNSIINELRGNRNNLHAEFEGYIGLLELSHNYVKQYCLLRNSNHRPEFRLTFANDTLSPLVDTLHEDASNVRKRYEDIFKYFKAKIADALPPRVRPATDGPDTLAKSYEEAEKIGIYLLQIAQFWDEEHNQVSRCTSQNALQTFMGRGSSALWEGYRTSLEAAIESITLSSDMILVDPPVTAHPRIANNKSQAGGFVNRFLRVFGFRR